MTILSLCRNSVLSLFFTAAVSLPAIAADQTAVLNTARAQIQRGDFKGASELLRAALYKDGHSPITWLLLGQSYERQNDSATAIRTYRMLIQHFPASIEAASARVFLSLLEKQRPITTASAQAGVQTTGVHSTGVHSTGVQSTGVQSTGVHPTGVPTAGSQPITPTPPASTTLELKQRITIIPPRFNHKPVAPSTVAVVRGVVAQLPPTIYQILNERGTQIFVEPNLIDKFPNAVSEKHAVLGHYLSQETGRTYGVDVYIYERIAVEGGSTELREPFSQAVLRANTYNLLGHALDTCLEMPSTEEKFRRIYRQDAAAVDPDRRAKLRDYLLDEETCAKEVFSALAASIMGDVTVEKELNRAFPRCRAWIEARIAQLAKK